MKQQVQVRSPNDIIPVLGKWKKRREENFLSVTLDSAHCVLRVHHVTKGILNRTIVHPRECFLPAIKDYSAAVLFVHNHPSGNAQPSEEDDVVTTRLCITGKIIGIDVLDHIIISRFGSYYSYRQEGRIKSVFSDVALQNFVDTILTQENRS